MQLYEDISGKQIQEQVNFVACRVGNMTYNGVTGIRHKHQQMKNNEQQWKCGIQTEKMP